ncbi:MAG: NYN domain-containing protein [Clostridiales bacterium]|jgi:hypothetical protein|nr:NYN domain-containing protein [Clostridiales bacterium]
MNLEFRAIKKPPDNVGQLNSVVFIDYEYLYLSFLKIFKVQPNLNSILNEVKANGRIQKIKVFGDFTKNEINQERSRIRTITSDIIDCGNEALENKKDFTDFIMLDHIYQETIQNTSIGQFIFFTGDGHFSSVSTFLRTFMDKTVGVYGITKTLSRQLNECSTWTKYIEVVDDADEIYQQRLIRNFKFAQEKSIILTFRNTVEHTHNNYGGDINKYEYVLRKMIDDGYVSSEICTAFSDREFRMIIPQWHKIQEDLINR